MRSTLSLGFVSWWVALALGACAGPGAAPETPKLAPSSAEPATRPSTSAAAAPSTASAPTADAGPPPAKPFALADLTPPHERSTLPGDGKWAPVPEVGESGGQPLALRTTIHPHPFKKDAYVALIAFDLERTELVWMPGTREPSDKLPDSVKRGVIPQQDHEHLLVAFNGGFLAKHGKFGAMAEGHQLLAPREGACTIATAKAGQVRVAPWEDLAPGAAELTSYRQTPPCLLHASEPHPRLGIEPVKWGLSAEGKDEIRRSALGIDASGRVLLFGLGEWVVPKEMALAMKVAGAVSAAELDINWSYTRFNFYGRKAEGEPLQVVGTLVPKLVHTKKSYVADLAERDFFYVKKKR